MKKKIGILIIGIFFLSYSLTASGLFNETYQDPDLNYRQIVKHLNDGRQPPNPGDMAPDFVININANHNIISNKPLEAFNADQETIEEILDLIDETLILGYLEDLTAFGPRVTGTTACHDAGDYIYDEFESYGLDVRYDDWSYSGYSGFNIEGTLQGIDEESDEIYVICAHYDSVPGSPGADDDGSGTAAVLAAAYSMSQFQFNHTIRFVTFDGEEQGLLGSHEYAEEASLNDDNIVGALNGDMIGYAENPTQASYIKIYEDSASEWITDITEQASQDYYDYCGLEIVPSGAAWNSDHASFWSFGYNAIMYHEYKFNAYYHSPNDIIDNMDIDYSTRVTRLEIATLATLAESQVLNNPPSKPTIDGQKVGTENEVMTYSATSTDPEEDQIFYEFDWDDGNTDWLGPYESGEMMQTSHMWELPGSYEVKVRAIDIKNRVSDWSNPLTVTIGENQGPDAPTIKAPNIGISGKPFEITISTVDPEGHDVYYYINWGDGNNDFWLGPYSSGEEVSLNHFYKQGGSITITVKSKDQHDALGFQSSANIYIIKNRAFEYKQRFHFIDNMINQLFRIIKILIF